MTDHSSTSHDVVWTTEKVQRFWDEYSVREHGMYFSALHAPALARWIHRHARPGRQRVIDLGCGTGELLAELSRRGYSTLGIDSSEETVRVAATRIGEENVLLGSVTNIPVDAQSASGLLLIETIEHVLDGDVAPMMQEIRRVLAPGSPLVITTPNGEDLELAKVVCPDCSGRFHPMQHVRSWTAQGLARFLRQAGFSDVTVHETRLPMRQGTARFAAEAWYWLRRDRPHLIAVARE